MKKLLLLSVLLSALVSCDKEDLPTCKWEVKNQQQNIDEQGIYTITTYQNSCTGELKYKIIR